MRFWPSWSWQDSADSDSLPSYRLWRFASITSYQPAVKDARLGRDKIQVTIRGLPGLRLALPSYFMA